MTTVRSLLATLVLAAVASPVGAQGIRDHLKCHTMKDPQRVAATADLAAKLQPFSDSGCKIGRPKYFCTPATALGLPPSPETAGQAIQNEVICYNLKCPTRPPDQEVVDRFGTRTQTRYRSSLLCVPARATGETTPTTTTPVRPKCIGTPEIDPDGTVTQLVRGQPNDIPIRVSSTSGGNFTLFLFQSPDLDGQVTCGAGCGVIPVNQCGGQDFVFTYTPELDAPASLTLVVHANPHGVPFDCGIGSPTNFDEKAFPIVDP